MPVRRSNFSLLLQNRFKKPAERNRNEKTEKL